MPNNASSNIVVPGYTKNGYAIFILGTDSVVNLQPTDLRMACSYALTTKPSGSSASISGTGFTPDRVGQYVATTTQGTDVFTVAVNAFTAAQYAALTPLSGGTYSDSEKRSILLSLSDGLLGSWATPVLPNINLLPYGAR